MRLQNIIGMRTIKTGIAVMLCCILTRFAVDNMFYCAIACVVTMQDTIKTSFKMGTQRVFGTLIGGLIGFLLVLISPANPVLCGIGIMLVIKCCNMFKLSSLVVSSVTFLSLYLGYVDRAPLLYSIQRIIDTSIGVIMGLIINYSVARPNYYDNTINEFEKIKSLCEESLRNIVIGKRDLQLDSIENKIKTSETIYSKLIDELNYSKGSFNLDIIDKSLDLCRQIFFHIKSIELLEKELFLTKDNYKRLKKLYKNEQILLQVNEDESPVFNFHLNKVIEKTNLLEELIEPNC
ncbi:FUSC family protein [Terrisporobacter petrolearius]|uniref:FUSC family protein n=1 Tax=Terrisporobacter petrolearius TaxID=1460447 RepID=UPI001D169E50|nr:aromatic acid exporter family protein [Terrisporobacter petrolearius]MCC3866018.1 FUSC family protein [Terrisporobacter petrolearius]